MTIPKQTPHWNPLPIIAVCVLIFIAIYTTRKATRDRPSNSETDISSNADFVKDPVSQVSPSLDSQKLEKDKRLLDDILSIPEADPGLLEFRITPLRSSCKPSDYEMIRNSVKSLRDKSLVLELRSLTLGQRSIANLSVLEVDAKNRFRLSAKYKNEDSDRSQILLLSLCQDESKTLTCRNKKIFTHHDYKLLVEKDFKDRTYYLQLIIKDQYGYQLVPTLNWDKKSFQNKLKLFQRSSNFSEDDLEEIRQMIAELKPIPASLKGRSLVLPLLAIDPMCN